jgi:uncharacterized 2Fe-2S/4Fe-4S cluster protein (DUF4445 family)
MKAGVHINASCGGRGVCGKCRVRMAEGSLGSSIHPSISEGDHTMGFRLACASSVTGDAVIEIPLESQVDRSVLRRSTIMSDVDAGAIDGGLLREYGREPLVERHKLDLPRPDLQDNVSDAARITRELAPRLGCEELLLPLKVLRGLGTGLRNADWNVTVDVDVGVRREVTGITKGDREKSHYAIAVDIGTTTIAAQLLVCVGGASEGVILASSSDYNGQISFGEDVISRIMYTRKRGGLKKLQDVVVSTINLLIGELLYEGGIDPADISHIVVAGNTTMMHLFYGVEPKHIMLAPYAPLATAFAPVACSEIGVKTAAHTRLFAIPGVSSYVGGDIVSGVALSGMTESDEVSLFMDIGTNGEIVLGNGQWLLCASCSAGPAFEGGGIEFGMRAAPGAIEKVRVNPVTLEPMILTIGRAKPLGICGSGLIDIVAELFLAGVIDRNGKFSLDKTAARVREGVSGREYVLCFAAETNIERDIVLTEIDLDNIMRTKAAVYAGCKVLLEHGGLAFGDLGMVIIAGGFGHSIDVEKAIAVGLLPELPAERFRFMGNASLGGARIAAISRRFFEKANQVARSMTNIELSNDTQFMDEFMAAMFLPHTDDRAFPETIKALKGGSGFRVPGSGS